MLDTSPHATPPYVVEATPASARIVVGRLGLCDAYPLRDAIARLLPRPVILDCAHAELPDSVLGILALWLADLDHPSLEVRGLARHGEAIVRCCGCDWALPAHRLSDPEADGHTS